jgi:hypothetical protein
MPGMREGGLDNGYNAGDMRRKLFNVLSAVSLVLCVATAVMWVRSVSQCDSIYYTAESGARLSISDNTFVLNVIRMPTLVGDAAALDPPKRGLSWRSDKWGSPRIYTINGLDTFSQGGRTLTISKATLSFLAKPWKPAAHGFLGFRWEGSQNLSSPGVWRARPDLARLGSNVVFDSVFCHATGNTLLDETS